MSEDEALTRWRVAADAIGRLLLSHSELSAAFAWYEPVRHHHKVHLHGQEGDQQAAQTEGEEERVEGKH